jgi:hypothetical protein
MTKVLPFTESAVRRGDLSRMAGEPAPQLGARVSHDDKVISDFGFLVKHGQMSLALLTVVVLASLLVVAGGYLGLYLGSRDGGCPL